MLQYILYTYQPVNGQEICHAYGPADQPTAQAEGERLQAATPAIGFMVLELEQISPTTTATVAAPATRGDTVSDTNPFDAEPSSGPGSEKAPVAAPADAQDAPDAPEPEHVPQEGENGSEAQDASAAEDAGSDSSTSDEQAEPEQEGDEHVPAA